MSGARVEHIQATYRRLWHANESVIRLFELGDIQVQRGMRHSLLPLAYNGLKVPCYCRFLAGARLTLMLMRVPTTGRLELTIRIILMYSDGHARHYRGLF